MSVRLYTICAMCVTASAVAGVVVGGMLAASSRTGTPPQPVVPVSQNVPSLEAAVGVPSLEAAGGMGVARP